MCSEPIKGRSQQELADDLGITRSCYSKYEYGLAESSIELLVRIFRYYGLSIDDLVSVDQCRGVVADMSGIL